MYSEKNDCEIVKVIGMTISDVYKKGGQKPIGKPKSRQHIKNTKDTSIQYLD